MTSNSTPAALSADTAIPEQIEKEVRKLAELLPLQGPITAFAFLNPLQGMEHRPFAEVLRSVGEIYGCEPFLTENRYRQKMSRGRITDQDLREVLLEEPDFRPEEMVGGLVRRIDLRLSMLQYPLTPGTENELRWMIAESDALQRFRPEMSHESRDRLLEETQHWIMRDKRADTTAEAAGSPVPECSPVIQEILDQFGRRSMESWTEKQWERVCLTLLWKLSLCRLASSPVPSTTLSRRTRLRDLLMEETSVDSDEMVNEVLVGFCAAYLDQGYAHWRLPNRDAGFLRSFCELFQTPSFGARRWLRDLSRLLEPMATGQQTAAQSIQESLNELGISDSERLEFLRASLLALRGWAGMVWQTEDRPDRVYRYSPPGTLTEFLAIRLILDRLASKAVADESSDARGSLAEIRAKLRAKEAPAPHAVNEQRAFLIMQLAQIHGWCPRMLAELSNDNWNALLKEMDGFCQLERRRIFHLAFERQLARRALDAIAVRSAQPLKRPEQPQLQIVTCIDAREESFRRHLEELAPDVETFGNAGFFCVPMYYRGAGEATFTALCPIVIKPQNWIVEDVVYALEDSHRQRAAARRILGRATHGFDTGTRSSLTGAVLTALLGPLATAPLLGRILFPRTMAQMHRTARRFVAPPAITRLRLERPEGTKAGPTEEGIGFTLTEMVNMSERSLRDIGLTSNFARLVMFLGHGSNCLNNPHESAYHCGACSGSPGGANARALAAMLNDIRVRRQLKERGLVIPEETYFIGGLHNTATEEITFYDLELLPTSHLGSLRLARDLFSRVAERNAHERCRRFESARLDLSPSEALLHVQERAEDLAQTRPEYGNCTNAVCFVGRRSRIRGLYLDRRSFMMSYDKSQDNEKNMILARILGAVIPVCEGINMLYTLSAIDSRGWGSGTKLPHNVTSLLGVMDGAASDLRPGLPWQGVDIHEPVRLLFVIESTPEAMLQIMNDNPTVANICRNGWAQLAVLDPNSPNLKRFVNGQFVDYTPGTADLPAVDSSLEWYRGWRDHLPFALIRNQA